MSIAPFDELLQFLEDRLTGVDTTIRESIPPEEKLVVTLRYLGSGCTMTDLYLYFRLGISTVSKIVKQVTQIWRTMKSVCLAQLDAEKWKCLAEDFYSAANYPNCEGAMDGKHQFDGISEEISVPAMEECRWVWTEQGCQKSPFTLCMCHVQDGH